MKLLSTQRNSCGRQLICDDTEFDPSLISITNIDSVEKVVTFKYDFSECGHPLNLPFDARNVDFILKITPCNIHMCAVAELGNYFYDELKEFANNLGDIEFDVRMTTDEKFDLLLAIVFDFLNEAKTEKN